MPSFQFIDRATGKAALIRELDSAIANEFGWDEHETLANNFDKVAQFGIQVLLDMNKKQMNLEIWNSWIAEVQPNLPENTLRSYRKFLVDCYTFILHM